jgi:hypothetical protein
MTDLGPMPDASHIIRAAGLADWVLPGRKYPGVLPEGVRDYYCYTRDGGHSLLVVLEDEYRHGAPPERFVVAAPVKMVLREGYRLRDGYLWAKLPYTRDVGLAVRDEDVEY